MILSPNLDATESVPDTLQSGGITRSFRLYIPAHLSTNTPAPLVFVFHGGGSDAIQAERMSKFSRIADREGFVVIYPDAVERNWNDGRTGADLKAQVLNVDDLLFVENLIASAAAKQPVDPDRIFATGISNGGMLSHFLAARNSTRFAAIAPVVGGLAEPIAETFNPDTPVSVLIIQGTDDPIVPYHGGKVARGDRGKIVDTDKAAQLWVEKNGCAPEPETSEIPDKAFDDGCLVHVSKWSHGRGGSEVWLYRIEGGGHTWPSGPQYLPEHTIGRVCRDFDGSEAIWAFFKDHPKKR